MTNVIPLRQRLRDRILDPFRDEQIVLRYGEKPPVQKRRELIADTEPHYLSKESVGMHTKAIMWLLALTIVTMTFWEITK